MIEQKAIRQVGMLAASSVRLTRDPYIDDWPDEDIDRLVGQFEALPCPALNSDGSCSVYAFRPLVCRSMGIPSEVDGVVHGLVPFKHPCRSFVSLRPFAGKKLALWRQRQTRLHCCARQKEHRVTNCCFPMPFCLMTPGDRSSQRAKRA